MALPSTFLTYRQTALFFLVFLFLLVLFVLLVFRFLLFLVASVVFIFVRAGSSQQPATNAGLGPALAIDEQTYCRDVRIHVRPPVPGPERRSR